MSLSQQAYDILRKKIITREFEPGTVLSEQQIAETLGMSRTPIREALVRLQNDQLLKYVPQKGVSVREMTVKDFVNVGALMRALQYFAVSELVRLGEAFDTSEIEQLHEDQKAHISDPWRCFELNIEMHMKIAALLGNDMIVQVARNTSDLIILAGYVSSRANFPVALQEVFNEHETIVKALKDRDLEAFSEALCKHDEGALHRMIRLRM